MEMLYSCCRGAQRGSGGGTPPPDGGRSCRGRGRGDSEVQVVRSRRVGFKPGWEGRSRHAGPGLGRARLAVTRPIPFRPVSGHSHATARSRATCAATHALHARHAPRRAPWPVSGVAATEERTKMRCSRIAFAQRRVGAGPKPARTARPVRRRGGAIRPV